MNESNIGRGRDRSAGVAGGGGGAMWCSVPLHWLEGGGGLIKD